jgi:uncharacterized Zn finger protein
VNATEEGWSARFLSRLRALDLLRPDRAAGAGPGGGAGIGAGVSQLTVIAGSVDARVTDPDGSGYDVWVELPVFDSRQWARAEQALAAHDGVRDALLDGEVPAGTAGVLARAGLSLFPARAADLGLECSCPQWSQCPHVTAVLVELASAFDADPFLLFAWRGRGRERLQRHLGEVYAAALAARPGSPPAQEDPRPLSERIGDFWTEGEQSRALAASEATTGTHHEAGPGTGPASAQLGASGVVIRGRTLESLLQPAYEALLD